MAQGEFTKQEADETYKAVEEIFTALSRPKKIEFLGHLNDILLFINAAKQNAPDEQELNGDKAITAGKTE